MHRENVESGRTDVDIERERFKRFLHVLLSASRNSIREIHPSRETKLEGRETEILTIPVGGRGGDGARESTKAADLKNLFSPTCRWRQSSILPTSEDVLSWVGWKIAIGKSLGNHPDIRGFLRRRRRRRQLWHESVIFIKFRCSCREYMNSQAYLSVYNYVFKTYIYNLNISEQIIFIIVFIATLEYYLDNHFFLHYVSLYLYMLIKSSFFCV